MVRTFLNTFSQLPNSNKAMVYLMWIYGVGTLVTNIFINIYVFKLNDSFQDVAIYNIIFYTSTFLGFSGLGWYMGCIKRDIKNMYYIGYFLFILSFILLFTINGILGVYIFSVIYALGNGAFWNAVHTQELKNIKDKNRDFYSSSISAGINLIDILIPLCIAFLFFTSERFSFDGYSVLFGFLPLIYILSFIFIHRIDSYIPTKIKAVDIRNFFNMKKYKFGHIYFFIGGLKTGFKSVVIALASIILLKNEINIGIFQGLLAFLSTFLVVHFSFKRNKDNRLFYLGVLSLLLFINFLIFSILFNFTYFIIFSLISLILDPLYRVSEHTYDLSLMDNIKVGEGDFYPAMILREVFLWLGRITALMFLLGIFFYTKIDIESILKIGILSMGCCFLLKVWSIYAWEKYEQN